MKDFFSSLFSAQNAVDNADGGFPFWIFWLLVCIILLLLVFIFLRDKDLRHRLDSFFKGIKNRLRKVRLLATLKKEQQKHEDFMLELGRKAWEEDVEVPSANSLRNQLARLDKQKYPGIITSGTEKFPFLTNSTQLNVDATRDLFEALQHQMEIQPMYTGGTIFHSFLPESIDGVACKKLVLKIAETKLPYFSITPTFSVCRNHGYLAGEMPECPDCQERTEVYSRIVGYLRPVATWNDGKKQEFAERTPYSETSKGEERAIPTVHVSELPKV